MYKAQVFGTMTFYKEGEKIDSKHPFGTLEMYDVEADSLKQLVQKLAVHFGTDVKQFLAGYSDDDEKDSITRTGTYLVNEYNGNGVHHAMKITCGEKPVYFSEHPELFED
ncbi:hypothetical protein DW718_11630 [Weissella cibaria]|uniref:hypothetical protein n=1 Tax=Weissella cibaria TaxID=137591 RepID=UPI000E55076A|nr:hypothetical protein [Weissella cibaria]RHE69286.1 hypothetical protein DW718_11630 [Weissella cibaria]RHE75062.1 hypothetical protein DW717_11810 [Weissella cibaria]